MVLDSKDVLKQLDEAFAKKDNKQIQSLLSKFFKALEKKMIHDLKEASYLDNLEKVLLSYCQKLTSDREKLSEACTSIFETLNSTKFVKNFAQIKMNFLTQLCTLRVKESNPANCRDAINELIIKTLGEIVLCKISPLEKNINLLENIIKKNIDFNILNKFINKSIDTFFKTIKTSLDCRKSFWEVSYCKENEKGTRLKILNSYCSVISLLDNLLQKDRLKKISLDEMLKTCKRISIKLNSRNDGEFLKHQIMDRCTDFQNSMELGNTSDYQKMVSFINDVKSDLKDLTAYLGSKYRNSPCGDNSNYLDISPCYKIFIDSLETILTETQRRLDAPSNPTVQSISLEFYKKFMEDMIDTLNIFIDSYVNNFNFYFYEIQNNTSALNQFKKLLIEYKSFNNELTAKISSLEKELTKIKHLDSKNITILKSKILTLQSNFRKAFLYSSAPLVYTLAADENALNSGKLDQKKLFRHIENIEKGAEIFKDVLDRLNTLLINPVESPISINDGLKTSRILLDYEDSGLMLLGYMLLGYDSNKALYTECTKKLFEFFINLEKNKVGKSLPNCTIDKFSNILNVFLKNYKKYFKNDKNEFKTDIEKIRDGTALIKNASEFEKILETVQNKLDKIGEPFPDKADGLNENQKVFLQYIIEKISLDINSILSAYKDAGTKFLGMSLLYPNFNCSLYLKCTRNMSKLLNFCIINLKKLYNGKDISGTVSKFMEILGSFLTEYEKFFPSDEKFLTEIKILESEFISLGFKSSRATLIASNISLTSLPSPALSTPMPSNTPISPPSCSGLFRFSSVSNLNSSLTTCQSSVSKTIPPITRQQRSLTTTERPNIILR